MGLERVIIVNGSHRAPISNSRRFTKYLMKFLKTNSVEFLLNKNNYDEISKELFSSTKAVLVFPVYMDCMPSILIGFLARLEKLGEKYESRPTVYIMVNSGFIENEHSKASIDIAAYYLRRNGFTFGGALSIGSGESILDSPFRGLLLRRMKQFSKAIDSGDDVYLQTQMPIPKGFYLRAANKYWVLKGTAHGKTKKEMEAMEIR